MARAYRLQKKIGGNQPKSTNTTNFSETQDNQVNEAKHGGKREGAGPPQEYQKTLKPPRFR
jgi:hypothetical protein